MDTWTLQMGYPVLTFTEKNGSVYTVSQERFLYDRNANVTSKHNSPFKWVPNKSIDIDFSYKSEVEFFSFGTGRGGIVTLSKLSNLSKDPWIKCKVTAVWWVELKPF